MAFVVDTSVTAAWCIPDEVTSDTAKLLDRLLIEGGVAPAIWPFEITNVLLTAERRRRVTMEELVPLFAFLTELPIQVEAEGISYVFTVTADLGGTHQLTSYDAAYLELAMRLSLPLATLDKDLTRAANVVGVPVLT